MRTWASNPSGGGGGLQVAQGTYAGDGNATQAVAGVGFQPRFLIIYQRLTGNFGVQYKTDQDGAFSKGIDQGVGCVYETDHIVSLDADGFTVGDGTGTARGNVYNALGTNYTYIAYA